MYYSTKIKYSFLGDKLGGLPDGAQFRDEKGFICYDLIEKEERFQTAIKQLLEDVKNDRIALMCSEEPPAECHRSKLIGRVLASHGVKVLHIRGNGEVQTQEEVMKEIMSGQISLFGQGPPPYLRSSRPHPEKKKDENYPTYENH